MKTLALIWLISFVLMIPRMYYAFRHLRFGVPVLGIAICVIAAPVAGVVIWLGMLLNPDFRPETLSAFRHKGEL